jgi:NAD(P)-dependent dehydrogenase (short-subunit alcohol dehydrogenase family)
MMRGVHSSSISEERYNVGIDGYFQDTYMAQLSGKVAIVTGASSGIGLATARVLAQRGASVVLTGTRAANVEPGAAAIRQAGGKAEAMALDLADAASIKALIDAVIGKYGRIDILHNNAADLSVTRLDGDVEHTDVSVWDRVYSVNVRGTMLMCKHTLPHMVRQQSGSIINTASALGMQGATVQAAYAASKAAEIQMCRSIAASHGKQGVRCNAIVPGLILTEAAKANLPPPLFAIQESENCTPYLGAAEDIANAVAFLASDDARYITGQALVADGGASSHVSGYAQLNALGPPPG